MSSFPESTLLKYLVAQSANTGGYVIEGVKDQDDCAVLRIPDGQELCVTTDFIRGTGFYLYKQGYLNFEDIGYYLAAANLSDIAAMGATPLGFLSVLRYGPKRTLADMECVIAGIQLACSNHGCSLIGGDSGSYEADVYSGTALGIVASGKRLSRHTMQADHAVFVSGDIGRPAAAISAVANHKTEQHPDSFRDALEKWKRPEPRINLGKRLSEAAFQVSAMDVSDGLAASLQQLSRITKLGFVIYGNKLPISGAVKIIAHATGADVLTLACSASVDFELLFTAPQDKAARVMEIAESCNTRVTQIGVTTEKNSLVMIDSNGCEMDNFPGVPWDHQMSAIEDAFKTNG